MVAVMVGYPDREFVSSTLSYAECQSVLNGDPYTMFIIICDCIKNMLKIIQKSSSLPLMNPKSTYNCVSIIYSMVTIKVVLGFRGWVRV